MVDGEICSATSVISTTSFLILFPTFYAMIVRGDSWWWRTPGRNERSFYTVPEYNTWKDGHANGKGWNAKYYKVGIFFLVVQTNVPKGAKAA